MRWECAPGELFVRNRTRLRAMLRLNSIVILHANDIMPTNADGVMGFLQNTDLFHLTGIDQVDAVLVIRPHAIKE